MLPSDTRLRFQERDGRLLQAIYAYDGVLARRHIKDMFWPEASWRAMEMRLALLHRHDYLAWPSRADWWSKPIPEAVCWLGWRGIAWLAGQSGIETEPLASPTQTRLRRLERKLRDYGLRWLREPRWSQLTHDLAVVDVRRTLERAVAMLPAITLDTWLPESVFRSQMDVVEYTVRGRQRKRGVRPDGYFMIVDEQRATQGLPARARFLLEVDMATHDTGSFFEEKIAAGLAYVRSQAYQDRFGDNAGRWLVITTSDVRQKHLLREIARAGGGEVFWLSTLGQLESGNLLVSPIWWRVERRNPEALLQQAGGV